MENYLQLEDKTKFKGVSFGADASISGEVVFNTGMTGYPETLTDPSYKGQILVLTYPLIGNYGVPSDEKDELGLSKNFESEKIQISGLIISDYSEDHSHYSAIKSLGSWLKEHNVPALYGIDTRALTKKLREKGVMLGKIVNNEDVKLEDPNKRNLVAEVSIKNKTVYNKGGSKKVILIDTGVKNNIIRSLANRDIEVIRVPWDYDFLNEEYDGLFLSNGPGDPTMIKKTVENVKKAMSLGKPIFGICLGNQILGLAAGGKTYKLKYGHRSQNQPCTSTIDKRCLITSQNHGFALNAKTLPKEWKEFFKNENDETNEGIYHETKPFKSVQFHPEATPGPVDADYLFDEFVKMLK